MDKDLDPIKFNLVMGDKFNLVMVDCSISALAVLAHVANPQMMF